MNSFSGFFDLFFFWKISGFFFFLFLSAFVLLFGLRWLAGTFWRHGRCFWSWYFCFVFLFSPLVLWCLISTSRHLDLKEPRDLKVACVHSFDFISYLEFWSFLGKCLMDHWVLLESDTTMMLWRRSWDLCHLPFYFCFDNLLFSFNFLRKKTNTAQRIYTFSPITKW